MYDDVLLASAWKGAKDLGVSQIKSLHNRERFGATPGFLSTSWFRCVKGWFFFGITKHFRYLKWRNPHLYKQYGYGLCKGKSTYPK